MAISWKWVRLGILGLAMGLGGVALVATFMRNYGTSQVQDQKRQLPDLGGSFRLQDQFGHFRTDQEFRGKYMLVYFGYTYCPDVCPLGLENLTGALTLLGRDLLEVAPLFITIDPERDDVKTLSQFAEHWHKSMIFLTGTPKEIKDVGRAYKVYVQKATTDASSTDYLVDHSAFIYLMDRRGKLIDIFPHTAPSHEIFRKIRDCLTQERGKK